MKGHPGVYSGAEGYGTHMVIEGAYQSQSLCLSKSQVNCSEGEPGGQNVILAS